MRKQSMMQEIRSKSIEELEEELFSPYLDQNIRDAISNELSIRRNRKVTWHASAALIISILALAFSIIAVWDRVASWVS